MDNSNRDSVLADLEHWAETRGDIPWLVDLKGGASHAVTWAEGRETVERAAKAIRHHLKVPQKKAAILSRNRAHWIMADLAVLRAGMNTVPVFTTMRADTFRYVLEFADVELLFLGESANWADVKSHVPEGVRIVTLPGLDPAEGDISWGAFLTEGAAEALPAMPPLEDPATIIFTSGTTGKPKGVMHSLGSLRRATDGLVGETNSETGWNFFSYLPLAHLAERLIIELHSLRTGGTIYFNENLESFSSDLRIGRPDYFFGVPRIWDKLVQAVIAGTDGGAHALRAALTGEHAALAAASVREKLGLASVKHMVTTTAPVPPQTKEWFRLFGLELQDGYGQTEVLPITTTPKGTDKLGTVGRPIAGVEVRITSEGELLARGPGRSLGYYKMPEKTAETFVDGWVHTGDRAELDADGYLILRGRVKETFKTAKGKYVAPMPIEAQVLEEDLLDQACLVGHGLPQPVLLTVPSEAGFMAGQAAIEAAVRRHVSNVSAGLERHAQIGAVIVANEAWTIENGVLTHTMKVRRERVLGRYGTEIDTVAAQIHSGGDLIVTFSDA
jgi:long-chain acyl-CoA synthetase